MALVLRGGTDEADEAGGVVQSEMLPEATPVAGENEGAGNGREPKERLGGKDEKGGKKVKGPKEGKVKVVHGAGKGQAGGKGETTDKMVTPQSHYSHD